MILCARRAVPPVGTSRATVTQFPNPETDSDIIHPSYLGDTLRMRACWGRVLAQRSITVSLRVCISVTGIAVTRQEGSITSRVPLVSSSLPRQPRSAPSSSPRPSRTRSPLL